MGMSQDTYFRKELIPKIIKKIPKNKFKLNIDKSIITPL